MPNLQVRDFNVRNRSIANGTNFHFRTRRVKCGMDHAVVLSSICSVTAETKVDEQQPICGSCLRLGRECGGPQDPTVFIDENLYFKNEGSSKSQSWFRSQSKPPSSPKLLMPNVDPIPHLETLTQADDPELKETYSLPRKWDLDLPVEVYYISLLVNKFRVGKIGDGQGFSWLSLGLDSPPGEMTVAHRFTRNLAQAFFGHYLMLPEVIANSQVQYGKDLLMLKKELDHPGSIYNNYLLASILTAVLYETIALTSHFGWMIHASALERIIEASHPRHQDHDRHINFELHRPEGQRLSRMSTLVPFLAHALYLLFVSKVPVWSINFFLQISSLVPR